MPIPFGSTAQRRFATLPAAASWAAKLGDSISDTTIAYGEWFENVCNHFAWKPVNDNLLPNGSFETDITDVVLQAGGAGTASAQDATHALHGTKALKLTGPTAAGLFYYNIGGSFPGSLTCTQSGGIVNAVTPGVAGAGYDSAIMTSSGGGFTVQPTYAIAVDSTGIIRSVKILTGGTGGTSLPTFAVTVGSGATFTGTVAGGALTVINVTAGGSGYPSSPTCFATGGSPATAAVIIPYVDGIGGIQGGFISSGGTGYGSAPTLLIQTMRPFSRAYLSQGTVSSQAYTLIFSAYIPTASGVPRSGTTTFCQVVMTDQSNVTTTALVGLAGTADQFNQYSVTFTTPATCAMVYFQFGSTTSGANQIMWIDGVQLTKGAAVIPATYCDWTERGGISGAPIANVTGSTNTAIATLVPTATRGSGNSLLVGSAGIAAHQSTVANRVTKHTAAGIVFLEGGLNDLRYASSTFAGNAQTVAGISTALDTILTAMTAMSGPPKIVILGVTEFCEPPGQTAWNTLLPTGYVSYHDMADAIDDLLQRKATQYGALFIPLRRVMTPYAINANDIHPSVPYGHSIISETVIRALEQGR